MCIRCRLYYTYNSVLSSFSRISQLTKTHHSPTYTQNGIGDNIGPEISIVLSSEILAFPEVIMWKFRFCRIAFCVFDWSTLGRHRNLDGDNNRALNIQMFVRQKRVLSRSHYVETSSNSYPRGKKVNVRTSRQRNLTDFQECHRQPYTDVLYRGHSQ